ncbi:hypothetical protein EVAR_83424_1 [Eumeta japonica]|uniref:Uncharacterized protein n=1 Tax=Eumeta variegata TaxID=151549 RepID=A0A4C1TYG9_EUMVA|nr:hypothetical protein EVAR_83424_1 [Eumeta japonica]
MDVKACTKQKKRRTKEKWKENTLLAIFIDTLSITYPRLKFLAKGCTNTGWIYTSVTAIQVNLIQARTYFLFGLVLNSNPDPTFDTNSDLTFNTDPRFALDLDPGLAVDFDGDPDHALDVIIYYIRYVP